MKIEDLYPYKGSNTDYILSASVGTVQTINGISCAVTLIGEFSRLGERPTVGYRLTQCATLAEAKAVFARISRQPYDI